MRHVASGPFALALLLISSPVFAQSGPAGVWQMTVTTPTGPTVATLTLSQDGDVLSGDLKSQLGSAPATGTLSGSDVTLTASVDLQGTSFKLTVNGTLRDDQLVGSLKFGDFGEFPFTATRGSAAADPAPSAASVDSTGATSAPAAAAGDVSGKWDAVMTIAGLGDLQGTLTLQQDADKITGLLTSLLGEIKVSGTMSGTTVKLDFLADTPMGPIPIAMTGELGADGLAGKVNVAGMGEAAWKATRGK